MIPFNRLGILFKFFGGSIYSKEVRMSLTRVGRSLRRGGNVLDLGGGTGIMADLIYRVRQDLNCFLLDPARGMMEKGSCHIRKSSGVAESLPFKDSSFDAVLIGDALHHFSEPVRGLLETMRVLNPGGFLFIFDIDPGTRMGRVIKGMERFLGEPAHFQTPEELGRLLAEYGFSVRIDRYGWRYSITGKLG